MKRGKKLLMIVTLLCLAFVIYWSITGEKKRIRKPEETDSEFYLYFDEDDAERIDKIILRKQNIETYETNAKIEITDPDVIREIADQILALKLTENEKIDTQGLRENRISISFNVASPETNLYVGSDNRLLFDRITCSTDTKVVVEHALFTAEPQIDFEQWWKLAEDAISEVEHTKKIDIEQENESVQGNDTYINETAVDKMILGSDFAERYMSRADFLGFRVEELRLIRNGIYAKNGAIFKSEDLNVFFGSKTWYRGEVPVNEFPEELISDVERANLELLKEMEAAADDHEEARKVVASLQEAPYLQYLDQYRETGMEADMNFAEDMGIYYVVPGVIKHPVTFTEEQRLAMENGEEIVIVVDEVNGEERMLRKHPDSEPDANVYLWYEKGTEPDADTDTDTEVINAWFDMESGVHTLWHFSDDTIMKNVYEGDLYILKGAGTGAHLSLELASADQKEIKLPDADTMAWDTSVFGNYLFHDGRGYITAVYYLGD